MTTRSLTSNTARIALDQPSYGRREVLKRLSLFAIAAALGGAGWSGNMILNLLALLYPFIYLQSRHRSDSFSAVFYYAAATWSVIPGAYRFFGHGRSPLLPVLIWAALTVLCALPWVASYNQTFLPLSAIASLLLLAIPPLGLVSVAHPLIASGAWFPGTRWFGLALPLLLVGIYRQLGPPLTVIVLLMSFIVVHTRFHRPLHDPNIVPLNTNLGGPSLGAMKLDSQARELMIQKLVLAHLNGLLLFPESVLPGWSAVYDQRWSKVFSQLDRTHTGILLGTTIPMPNTEANWNVMLSRGYTEHLSYVQRIPVPLGMWQIGDQTHGFPLMLRFPATIRVWDRRVGVLVCYEQFLVWPALQTLARDPDFLFAPSNLYWAQGTRIPKIEHVSAQDWADLWDIPLYEASNR